MLVQYYFMLDGEEQPCAAPFSWLIRMHLESLWEESEFMPGMPWSRRVKCTNPWTDHEVCMVRCGFKYFFLARITDPQWRERMAHRGFSSLWAPSTTAGWAVTYRNSRTRRGRRMATTICKTFCCFLWRSSQRMSLRYRHCESHN